MKEIQRDGTTIRYRLEGKGNTTLLFVHGAFINQTYWDNQVAFFSPDFQVVTLDLPGHGESGRDRAHWSVEGFGQDVVTLIRELELQNVILIGHSMGACATLEAAVAYPEPIIGFIVVDMFKNAGTPLPDEYQEQAEALVENLKTDFENTSEQYAYLALLTPQTPEPVARRVATDYRTAYPPMGRPIIAQVFNYYQRERELLQQLKFKFYVINADYLPFNEEPLQRYLTVDHEIFHVPSTCHYPMIEDPDRFNQTLTEVIDKVLARK
ncbi:pimeloyl-ACP methyl ester carboxylesterase [Larkinella arboricola]|uniref:Pimeloyl-ACP methyl ester carboxylesterase n=1 Tax=Larkinella arboricola TaxID=643671 RepID=A0A327WTJ7_LARAB|nr:alpha/beta hydrolase [Larkinella arboricola]RAJ95720.1 pimeloyl-ACP methyl ester carboxylesterase [Larkinella arboricola]